MGATLIVARGNSRPPALNDSPARRQLKLWSDGDGETETGEKHTFFPLATHSLWVGESHKLCEKTSCRWLTAFKTDFEKKNNSSDGIQ